VIQGSAADIVCNVICKVIVFCFDLISFLCLFVILICFLDLY
jgi:hypothetical protein